MTTRKRIVLDADGRKRLRASIAHWKRLATGKRREGEEANSDHCALCARWLTDDCAASNKDACPVRQATGQRSCCGSPWVDAAYASIPNNLDSPEFRLAAKVELGFLRDLLAQSEEKP